MIHMLHHPLGRVSMIYPQMLPGRKLLVYPQVPLVSMVPAAPRWPGLFQTRHLNNIIQGMGDTHGSYSSSFLLV